MSFPKNQESDEESHHHPPDAPSSPPVTHTSQTSTGDTSSSSPITIRGDKFVITRDLRNSANLGRTVADGAAAAGHNLELCETLSQIDWSKVIEKSLSRLSSPEKTFILWRPRYIQPFAALFSGMQRVFCLLEATGDDGRLKITKLENEKMSDLDCYRTLTADISRGQVQARDHDKIDGKDNGDGDHQQTDEYRSSSSPAEGRGTRKYKSVVTDIINGKRRARLDSLARDAAADVAAAGHTELCEIVERIDWTQLVLHTVILAYIYDAFMGRAMVRRHECGRIRIIWISRSSNPWIFANVFSERQPLFGLVKETGSDGRLKIMKVSKAGVFSDLYLQTTNNPTPTAAISGSDQDRDNGYGSVDTLVQALKRIDWEKVVANRVVPRPPFSSSRSNRGGSLIRNREAEVGTSSTPIVGSDGRLKILKFQDSEESDLDGTSINHTVDLGPSRLMSNPENVAGTSDIGQLDEHTRNRQLRVTGTAAGAVGGCKKLIEILEKIDWLKVIEDSLSGSSSGRLFSWNRNRRNLIDNRSGLRLCLATFADGERQIFSVFLERRYSDGGYKILKLQDSVKSDLESYEDGKGDHQEEEADAENFKKILDELIRRLCLVSGITLTSSTSNTTSVSSRPSRWMPISEYFDENEALRMLMFLTFSDYPSNNDIDDEDEDGTDNDDADNDDDDQTEDMADDYEKKQRSEKKKNKRKKKKKNKRKKN